MALTFRPMSITLTSNGLMQTATAGSVGLRRVGVIGTSPFGPNSPIDCSLSDAFSLFGDPSQVSSSLYTLPFALGLMAQQQQPTRSTAFNLTVMRAGATNATIPVPALTGSTPVDSMTLTAIGAYAGSRGTNLSVAITNSGTAVTAIAVTDVTTSQLLQSFVAPPNGPDDLSSNAAIAATINGYNDVSNPFSVLQATSVATGSGALVPAAGTILFSTGTAGVDGAGTLGTDATIATLLAASLNSDIDLIVALFDAATVQGAILTHLNAALAALQFRAAVLGPALSTPYATLMNTTTAYVTTPSDRVQIWGNPIVQVRDPVTGFLRQKDGFYLAACAAALNAAGPIEETTDGMRIAGLTGLPLPVDLTAPLQTTQKVALETAGLAIAELVPHTPGVFVKESITTAPYSLDGVGENPMFQMSMRNQDDMVSKVAVTTARQFQGRPGTASTSQANLIATTIDDALASACGFLLGHSTTCTVSYNPTPVYNVSIQYIPQYPIRQEYITTQFSFF